MLIQSKYTKIFHSKDLTRQKYDELHNFAVLIQNHKNTVSQHVNDNLLHFLEYNKFQFIKEMREHFKDVIPSSFDAQLYTQVFTKKFPRKPTHFSRGMNWENYFLFLIFFSIR